MDQGLIQEVTKGSRTASTELQASLVSVTVSVHDLTIRERLQKSHLTQKDPTMGQHVFAVIIKTREITSFWFYYFMNSLFLNK